MARKTLGRVPDRKGYDWGVQWDPATGEVFVAYARSSGWGYEYKLVPNRKVSTAALALEVAAEHRKKS